MKNLSPILFTLLFTAAIQGMDTKSIAAATQAAAVYFNNARAGDIMLGAFKTGSKITLASDGVEIVSVEKYSPCRPKGPQLALVDESSSISGPDGTKMALVKTLNNNYNSESYRPKLTFTVNLSKQPDFITHKAALEFYYTHHVTATVAAGAGLSLCALAYADAVGKLTDSCVPYASIPFFLGCGIGLALGIYKYSTTPKEAFEYLSVVGQHSYSASGGLHMRTITCPPKVSLLTYEKAENNHPVLVNMGNGAKAQLYCNLDDAEIS